MKSPAVATSTRLRALTSSSPNRSTAITSPSGKPIKSLDGRTVLVTGDNGGLGEEFVRQALAHGAAKVYAAARAPRDWSDARVAPLPLDLTSADSVRRAAEAASDVDFLINNAAIAPADDSISGPEEERAASSTPTFSARSASPTPSPRSSPPTAEGRC